MRTHSALLAVPLLWAIACSSESSSPVRARVALQGKRRVARTGGVSSGGQGGTAAGSGGSSGGTLAGGGTAGSGGVSGGGNSAAARAVRPTRAAAEAAARVLLASVLARCSRA